ncbi:manganese efflux pump [Natronospora cellulosivora (SeqCode)]
MWQSMLLAVSSNLNDLTVGFSYGLNEGKIPWKGIAIIAIISGLTMAIGLLLGTLLSPFLLDGIEKYISAFVFASFGIWFVYQGLTNEINYKFIKKYTILCKRISLLSLITMGLALGLDSMALGFSGGLGNYPIVLTSLLTSLFSFLFLCIGIHLGSKLSKWLSGYSNIIAGIILIVIAILELI